MNYSDSGQTVFIRHLQVGGRHDTAHTCVKNFWRVKTRRDKSLIGVRLEILTNVTIITQMEGKERNKESNN